jgi:hypothetical protein
MYICKLHVALIKTQTDAQYWLRKYELLFTYLFIYLFIYLWCFLFIYLHIYFYHMPYYTSNKNSQRDALVQCFFMYMTYVW